MEEERGRGGVKLEVTPLMPCQENLNNLARQLWWLVDFPDNLGSSFNIFSIAFFPWTRLALLLSFVQVWDFALFFEIIRAIGLSQDRSSVGN
jgi:hypothetical protein